MICQMKLFLLQEQRVSSCLVQQPREAPSQAWVIKKSYLAGKLALKGKTGF